MLKIKNATLATDIGPTRPNNEDRVAKIAPDTFIVADGMGGHVAGEVASTAVIDMAEAVLRDEASLGVSEISLKKIITGANEKILEHVSNHPEYKGMGTTATLFHEEGGKGYFAHVGDTRLYVLRGGELRQVTRDHSYVNDLVEKGKITAEEARVHPQRNVLMRAVGVDENLIVDTGTFDVAEGDTIALMSDGVHSVVTDEEIARIIGDRAVENRAQALVDAALKNDSHDNISAIVIDY